MEVKPEIQKFELFSLYLEKVNFVTINCLGNHDDNERSG